MYVPTWMAGTSPAMTEPLRFQGRRRAVCRPRRRAPAAPVCVVWGAADPYASFPYDREQLTFFLAAELSVFDESGHWPHADNPERFAGVVVPFPRRARGG
jgi:pimeloyl-ACP methyl ester carboxylesterase